MFQTLLIP